MSFRTVVINKRSKIEIRHNCLIVRNEEEKWINIAEIGTLIIESTASAITTQALCEMAKNNINIVFCDEKHMPYGQLLNFYANHLSSGQIKRQCKWKKGLKEVAWKDIVIQKINWQKKVLEKYNKKDASDILSTYLSEVRDGDKTNREGHAAKVYFNALFGQGFGRRTNNEINAALNYGYAILLSAVAREIVAAGYITQIGIHHINEFNHYNLASDIMEVFRPIVDFFVTSIADFDNFKDVVSSIFTCKVVIAGKEQFLDVAIRIFTRGVLSFLEKDKDILKIEKIILEEGNEL